MITLANLAEATEQEIFDQVSTHLLTQGQKSVSPEGVNDCRYKSIDGLKCAAGCLISDQEYKHEMEGYIWPRLISKGQVPTAHRDLIMALQTIHDMEAVWRWPIALREYATAHKLQISELLANTQIISQ